MSYVVQVSIDIKGSSPIQVELPITIVHPASLFLNVPPLNLEIEKPSEKAFYSPAHAALLDEAKVDQPETFVVSARDSTLLSTSAAAEESDSISFISATLPSPSRLERLQKVKSKQIAATTTGRFSRASILRPHTNKGGYNNRDDTSELSVSIPPRPSTPPDILMKRQLLSASSPGSGVTLDGSAPEFSIPPPPPLPPVYHSGRT